MQTLRAAEAVTFERGYPGTASQASRVRADLAAITGKCPVAEDVILLASELAANATRHSRSGWPGGAFTVRADFHPDDYAWVEVIDQDGQWSEPRPDDENGRGLAIVAAIAGDGNWGISDGPAFRVVWFRLDWPPSAA